MLKLGFILMIVVICNSHISDAEYCHGKPDPNAKPNMQPIIDENYKFVKQVKNAKLYTVGSGDDEIYVVHLWGSPYEMGYAHGSLIKDRLATMIKSLWAYMESEIIHALNGTTKGIFKESFLKLVSDVGLDVALDLETGATELFTGKYFMEEINGMADTTGVDVKMIRRVHMIGELTKGTCSMFGAWGSALPYDGLLQLRALDWITDGGLQNYPQITVYHPSGSMGHAFANIGWSGWIGSISGFNSKKMAISEIGVYFSDPTFGADSRFGIPFTYLLRDILQFDNTIDDSKNRIMNADRTCNLVLGVGDGKSNKFNSVQYSKSVANFINDTNPLPVGDWHPPIKNIVYHGIDWLCPSFYQALATQLMSIYGNITAENSIRYVTAIEQSGSLMTVYYDFYYDYVYIANARADNESGPLDAYDRSFVKIRMSPLFDEKPPQ